MGRTRGTCAVQEPASLRISRLRAIQKKISPEPALGTNRNKKTGEFPRNQPPASICLLSAAPRPRAAQLESSTFSLYYVTM